MAIIGSFKRTGNNEFTGEIVTLSLQAKNVRIVPEANRSGDNAPSHRVFVGRVEIGAAWSKRSNEGRDFLGLKLDDPSFTAPIYANLFNDEQGEDYSLIWSRPTAAATRSKAPTKAPPGRTGRGRPPFHDKMSAVAAQRAPSDFGATTCRVRDWRLHSCMSPRRSSKIRGVSRVNSRCRFSDQLAWVHIQRSCDPPKNTDAGRDPSALDRSDVTHAQSRAGGQFLLRHVLVMAQTTHVGRHDLLEIHGGLGTRKGTIVLGMIVPIRYDWCSI